MPSSQLKRAGGRYKRSGINPSCRLKRRTRYRRLYRGPFVDAGRQRTPAPFRGDRAAKSEMTIDNIVSPLGASIWT